MNIIPIESTANPLVKRIRGLSNRAARRKSGLFIIEGVKVIDEALSRGAGIEDLVVSKTYLESGDHQILKDAQRVFLLNDKLFAELTDTETPQGVLAIARMHQCREDDLFKGSTPLVVILDRIQDPGNLGTIFRTALAFSASGLILSHGTVDPYNSKVVRAASGALFAMPFLSGLSLGEAITLVRDRGLKVVALTAPAEKTIGDLELSAPTAFILGNEGQGIEKDALEAADETAMIEISGESESLNVAIAASVALYEARSQRR